MNRLLQILIVISVYVFPDVTLAQVDTIFGCLNSTVALDGPMGFTFYSWEPSDGLIQTSGSRVLANVTQDRLYTVSAFNLAGPNLVANPEFENGNTGFTSEYTYAPQGSINQGTYTVGSSPADFNSGFTDCPDSITPDGFMLIADGSTTPETNIWCQRLTVEPGERYAFSFYFASLVNSSPAQFAVTFNGVQLGAAAQSEFQTCIWRQLSRFWDAGTTSSVEICISNQNLSAPGNDFGLDRISLRKLSPPTIESYFLKVAFPVSSTDTVRLCPGERYTDNGLNLGVNQTGSTVLTSFTGCDSTLTITTVPNDTTIQNVRIDSLCPGQTYDFNGVLLDRDTTLCQTFVSSTGCDSLYCLTLKYFDEAAIVLDIVQPSCSSITGGTVAVTQTAGRPPFTYSWNDGASGANRSNLPEGDYVVTVTDGSGCSAATQLSLIQPAAIEISEIFTLPVRCIGEQTGFILVNATGGVGTITTTISSNGIEYPFDALTNGNYQISLSDEGGCTIDTFATIGAPNPVRAALSGDTLLRLGAEVTHQGSFSGDNATGTWTYNDISIDSLVVNGSITWRPPGEGLLSLTVRDENGCEDIASLYVRAQSSDTPFFPNAFSPNEDGINDSFGPFPEPAFVLLEEFSVFDRWGNLYYSVSDCPIDPLNSCFWTGRTRNGKQAEVGIYVYYAKIRLIDNTVIVRSGDVLLSSTIRN